MSVSTLKITIGLDAGLMAVAHALLANAGITLAAGNPEPSTLTGDGTAVAPASPVPSAPNSPAPAPPSAGGSPAPSGPATAGPTGVELDAAGVPWDANKHAGTKAKVKSGLWRMKVGVTRPDGEGENSPNYRAPGSEAAGSAPADAGSPSSTPATAAPSTPAPPAPPSPAAPAVDPNRPTDPNYCHDNGDGTEQWYVNGNWDAGRHPIPSAGAAAAPATEEEDEFAAFRNAGAAAAPAAGAARSWTDADLSALCNQAALKAGDPEKVKGIIGRYVPAGEVNHSRNVPTDKREEFATALETELGFQYAAG